MALIVWQSLYGSVVNLGIIKYANNITEKISDIKPGAFHYRQFVTEVLLQSLLISPLRSALLTNLISNHQIATPPNTGLELKFTK